MRHNGSSWRVEPGKPRTGVNPAKRVHDVSSIFSADIPALNAEHFRIVTTTRRNDTHYYCPTHAFLLRGPYPRTYPQNRRKSIKTSLHCKTATIFVFSTLKNPCMQCFSKIVRDESSLAKVY
ncbi:hypothetical protein Y032_0557g3405 [Ancylostoma ceylanicum]|uniref:Uncharacterized protein n=1 Tax=Ancylostoma ceylanicum TaxID=53326 RepID=A0A016WR78_9BILA|nr:hypothetical protein Y032_0557g3405 [Ancylostoma ceylanicum]